MTWDVNLSFINLLAWWAQTCSRCLPIGSVETNSHQLFTHLAAPDTRNPASSWSIWVTIMSATEGFLAAIISRQSAQLDQYEAPEVNTALRKPMPPMVDGKLATSQYMELGGTDTS